MSKFCKTQVMCPYCAENHQADTCPQKARTTSNCTACARRMKTYNPLLDLPQLFSTTPLILCHSPLDPICPARIALVFEKAKLATEPRQQTQVADSNCTPPPQQRYPSQVVRESRLITHLLNVNLTTAHCKPVPRPWLPMRTPSWMYLNECTTQRSTPDNQHSCHSAAELLSFTINHQLTL